VVFGFANKARPPRSAGLLSARPREPRLRQTSAYELHDDVVQNLTVAQLALALKEPAKAAGAIDRALQVAQHIVNLLLSSRVPNEPGSFIRVRPPELPEAATHPAEVEARASAPAPRATR
jgi:hypothetical protein